MTTVKEEKYETRLDLVTEPVTAPIDNDAVLPEKLPDEAEQTGNTEEVGRKFLLLFLSNRMINFMNRILPTNSKGTSFK